MSLSEYPLFDLGRLVGTPGALEALENNGQQPQAFIYRHHHGDWGEMPKEDQKENDLSVEKGFRVMSAYRLRDGTNIWVITEADRSATTVLLPSEY